MSEEPLYSKSVHRALWWAGGGGGSYTRVAGTPACRSEGVEPPPGPPWVDRYVYRGTLLIRNRPPPTITVGLGIGLL